MMVADAFILGSACFWVAIFMTKCRDAWYEAYYNDDGSKREFL